MIQCSDQVTVLIIGSFILFAQKKFHFKCNDTCKLDISCIIFSNVIGNIISLVLRDTDTSSENVSLVQHLVSDGQKTCSLKCVTLIGIK